MQEVVRCSWITVTGTAEFMQHVGGAAVQWRTAPVEL